MPMLFSVISRGTSILAEYAIVPGNFVEIVQHVLPQISNSKESRLTYSHSNYLFHYLSENDLIFLVITDKDFDKSMAFRYLTEIQRRFVMRYNVQAKKALPYAMNSEFSQVMFAEMKHYNIAEPSRITVMQDQVEEIKNILVHNIEEITNRGEKLELLIDKTETLSNNSVAFHRTSRTVKQKMWWKNAKWICIIVIIAILVLYAIISLSCGGLAWQGCVGTNKNDNSTIPH